MKGVFTRILILSLVASGFLNGPLHLCQDKVKVQVPQDFAYPEAMAEVLLETPIVAGSLSGKVFNWNGDELEKVLVERVTPDWRTRIDATFTDSEGCFYLPSPPSGRYYLRFSLPGWGTVLAKIKVSKKTKSQIKVELPVAN